MAPESLRDLNLRDRGTPKLERTDEIRVNPLQAQQQRRMARWEAPEEQHTLRVPLDPLEVWRGGVSGHMRSVVDPLAATVAALRPRRALLDSDSDDPSL
jgi:hypothetical protein